MSLVYWLLQFNNTSSDIRVYDLKNSLGWISATTLDSFDNQTVATGSCFNGRMISPGENVH